jgi:DHA1 family multidrug resistance protein-like MFS transporter
MKHLPHQPSPAPSYSTLLWLCCAIVFGCYLGAYMRLPVVPLFARSLGADTFQVGLINSAFFLTAGLLSFPLGLISDRLGYKLLSSLGLLILASSSFLLYFSQTPGELVWIHLFSGIGLAAFGPTIMAFVADFSPLTHLGRSYGWYTTALYTGMSLGPAAGGFVAQGWGFLKLFLASGVIILATFWLLALFLPRPRFMPAGSAGVTKSIPTLSRELLGNHPLLGSWLATLGGCFGLGMFITFVPLHAHNQGLTIWQIGLVFSGQGLVNALSRIPFGHLSDRVRRRQGLVVAGLLGLAVSLAGFGFSRSLGHFLLSAVALGCSMGLAFTSIGALIAETVPPESRGLAMGGYNSCIYLGMMLSSALMGALIRHIGFTNGFLLSALLNFLLIAWFHHLLRGFSLNRGQPRA